MGIGRIGRAVIVAGATAAMVVTGMSSASASAQQAQQYVPVAAHVQGTGHATAGATAPALIHRVAASPKAMSDCYPGQVCIYAGESFSGKPTNSYTAYAVYKLYEQYDWHFIYNHQTGGAKFKLCTGSNGTGCTAGYGPGTYDAYLTPYNSIVLYP